MSATFYQGDEAYIHVAFTDRVTGALADPTTIMLALLNPQGVAYHYTYALGTVTRDSLGTYHVLRNMDVGGLWCARWVGDGALKAAVQYRLWVEPAYVL
jgi:hypothetical protein